MGSSFLKLVYQCLDCPKRLQKAMLAVDKSGAPKLKKLVIDDSGIGYKDIDSSTSGLVELRTPSNLLSFVYRGLVSAYILSLDYISELVGVEICVFTKPFDKEEDGRGAIRILNCLCNIKTLALKGFEPLRFPRQVTDLLGNTLTSFTNLKTLELRTTIDEVGFLLTKCSSIETLVLLLTKRKKKGKIVLPKQCSLINLKCVAVRGVSGLNNELGFLKFLLDNAVVLERMTITRYANRSLQYQTRNIKSANNQEVPRDKLMKFGDKLLKLSQKFPTVELSLQIL